MFTVQSNVSSHISRLEKELGVTLVDRAHGGLTEEGSRVVERARRVLREIDDITADMASRDSDGVGPEPHRGDRHDRAMADAAVPRPARTATPERASDHPGRRDLDARAERAVRPAQRRGDPSARSTIPSSSSSRCSPRTCCCSPTRAIRSPRTTLIHLADLDEVPLLLPPTGCGAAPGARPRRGVGRHHPAAQAEVDGVRLLASLAIDGFGAAIVPATAVPVWLQGSFRRITVPELPRRVVAFARRRRPRAERADHGRAARRCATSSATRAAISTACTSTPPSLTTPRHESDARLLSGAMTSGSPPPTTGGATRPGDLHLSRLDPRRGSADAAQIDDRDVIWIDVDQPGEMVHLSSTTSAKIEMRSAHRARRRAARRARAVERRRRHRRGHAGAPRLGPPRLGARRVLRPGSRRSSWSTGQPCRGRRCCSGWPTSR